MVRDQTTEGNDRTPGYRNRRLKILGQDEIDEIYGLPRFSDEERELYFALTPSEEAAIIEELHSRGLSSNGTETWNKNLQFT